MSFRLKNPPFPKHSDLHKEVSIPSVDYKTDAEKQIISDDYDDKTQAAKEDADAVGGNSNRKAHKNGPPVAGHNRHAVKSDAQKKVDQKKEEFDTMSDAEKKAMQDAADDKADKFHKRGKYSK